jgi:butyryl-CoA dehydrogenase
MDLNLNEEQQLLQESLRGFAQGEILPDAAEIDHKGVFPQSHIDKMAEMGLMGMFIPSHYDGAGMGVLEYVIALEEIAAACGSCAVIMSVNNSLVSDPLLRFGTEQQKQRWLPGIATGSFTGCFALSEPGTGSDAAAQETQAKRVGDGWTINGAKNWITNGAQADVCIVFAMGDRSKGVRGINAYLVPTDTPGFIVAKNEEKLGIKASSTSQITLDDIRLPADALLGEVGKGFKVAMSTLDGGRIGIAAQAIGIARQAFEEARDYAKERVAFGAPIARLQAIQFKLADMALEIDAARLLTYRAASLKDEGQAYGPQAAMAKLYASEMATRVTHQAIQVFGGFGYSKEFPAERHYRDARITEIYEGTSEIQRIVIARSALSGS